jgi:urease accessory protein
MSSRILPVLLVAIAGLVLAQPALAHEQTGVGGGLIRGLLHPLT